MIQWLISALFNHPPTERLLSYISFRSLMAMLTSFLIALLVGRKLITTIYQLNFKDKSRDLGDISARNKSGTPTMGGLIIFFSFIFSVILWGRLSNFFVQISLFCGTWFVAIGFIDDYLKSLRGSSENGMNRGMKLLLQGLYGLILAILVLSPHSSPFPSAIGTKLFLPFLKNPVLDLGGFYYLFIILVIIAIANAINFADGMDGLATVPTIFLTAVYAIFAYILGNFKISHYLLFPFIIGSGELVVVLAALVGSLAAFLWFNTYPAEIFMGDTGSLFLGGMIATSSILLKSEVLFLIAGGVFVLEFVSVFIQDYIGIKLMKRRIFYRAPIHHTFQFMGIAEPKIVVRFWIVSAMFTLLALISIKLR